MFLSCILVPCGFYFIKSTCGFYTRLPSIREDADLLSTQLKEFHYERN